MRDCYVLSIFWCLLAAFIGFLWEDKQVFESYSNAEKQISIIFMILQTIIFIDLFDLASIKLMKRYDEGQTSYAAVLIVLSLIFFEAAIMLNVLGYVYFGSVMAVGTHFGSIFQTLYYQSSCQFSTIQLEQTEQSANDRNGLILRVYLAFICQFSYSGGTSNDSGGSYRMTDASLATDIVASTLFFVFTMYGSIMVGSGEVKVTADIDLNKAVGGPSPAAKEGQANCSYGCSASEKGASKQ